MPPSGVVKWIFGFRSVILRQLTRRVGLVPEAMTDRIQQLPMVFDRP